MVLIGLLVFHDDLHALPAVGAEHADRRDGVDGVAVAELPAEGAQVITRLCK